MSEINLTQTDLNESLRGLTDVDIMMFLPDKNISFPSNAVTVNKQSLQYTTNLQSLIEFSNLPQANLATFENNSWILDGSFISPTAAYGGGGDSYTGYISNDYTDDNGDYTTDPVITITLSAPAKIEYLSLKFAGGISTSYPKNLNVTLYDNEGGQIALWGFDISKQTGLPLLVMHLNAENVKKIALRFIGTVCPHRRTRLDKIFFGKVEQVDNYYLQSWKIDDKASLVADSIPSRTLTYSVINYDGDYNIDNPGTKIPKTYKDAKVLFTFSMEKDGLWKYAPTKTFDLMDISTTQDGIVTFTCGSILDTLTETYDHDIYTGEKTVEEVMRGLMIFSGIGTDQYILNQFARYRINVPLPEAPVREIIQKLAFSCGATLLVDDDNKIIFTQKNIKDTTYASKFMFNQPVPFTSAGVLLEEPSAEALANTTNIAMCTYNSVVEKEESELGSSDISVITRTKISFSPTQGIAMPDAQSLQDQHANIQILEVFSQHAVIQVSWDETKAIPPIKVAMRGKKVNTTKTIPKTADMDTLLLDSGITHTAPNNLIRPHTGADETIFYYSDWYGAKFKYVCKTRNEYLVKAGDIILFETPFSNGKPTRVGYVLRNSYSDTDNGGEMEVITIGDNS